MTKTCKKFLLTVLGVIFVVCLACFTACSCNGTTTYNLSFTVGEQVYETIKTDGKSIVSMPSNPQKTGYEFGGWYFDKDTWQRPFYENLFLDEPITEDKIIYAKLNIINYNITYELNGGTNNASNPDTYNVEDEIEFATPTRSGYIFNGWDIPTIQKGSTGNKTVTASWKLAQYVRVDADGNASADGNYILFGSYPQTDVTSTMGEELSAFAETLPTDGNNGTWTSYGYYASGASANYMWYKDVNYNQNTYRAIYFTAYRPNRVTKSSSATSSEVDGNGYSTSSVYWFKFEPIKWRILTERSNGTALILCDMIIDSQAYDRDGDTYSNNYENSTIRAWLNDNFYNTAFSESEKQIILTTTVDNRVATGNPYGCADTQDKVFLASYSEVVYSYYGFSDYGVQDPARQKVATAYAKAQGCQVSNDKGQWLLRSPLSNASDKVYMVSRVGLANSTVSVDYTYRGIVPAINVDLN